jgi:outer membrane protein OmpA-like peptidoglycan-associated protein
MKKPSIFPVSLFFLIQAFLLVGGSYGQAGGDVRRRTVAITYFKDPVPVQLQGTTLRPQAHGEATVERWRKRNESEIDIKVEKLNPAYNYGGDYTTYVLWAITPEGQVSNLGEFRLSGGTGHLHAATPYQTFAMIVTAEPHFLVELPSKKVVLENLAPVSKNATVQSSEIYFTGDPGKYYTDDEIPAAAERDFAKTPMELLQARRAVQIAKLADGERFDSADMKQALDSLGQAEAAFQHGRPVHEVGRICRDAISYAVKTRKIAEDRAVAQVRRAEIVRRDEEVRRATENATDLQGQLSDTSARLRASELSRTNTEDQLNRALRDAAESRAENRTLQAEIDRLRSDNDRMSRDLADARAQLTGMQSQVSAANSKAAEEASRAAAVERAERERHEAEAKRRDFAELQGGLSRILTVKPYGSGFIAVLPDSFFVYNKTDLALRIKGKMDSLGQMLAAHPDVAFTIQGYSDTRPTADSFAMGRAQAVADYILALGVARQNVKVDSQGDSSPVSRGKTAQARALNRRVELVFMLPSGANP